jgi:hypothetical protein
MLTLLGRKKSRQGNRHSSKPQQCQINEHPGWRVVETESDRSASGAELCQVIGEPVNFSA